MNKAIKATYTAIREAKGLDQHKAEEVAEALHIVASILHTIDEAECSYRMGDELSKALEASHTLIREALKDYVLFELRTQVEMGGDPRGCAFSIKDLPRNGWGDGYCVNHTLPWQDLEE